MFARGERLGAAGQHEVTLAEDGEHAVELGSRGEFDILLMGRPPAHVEVTSQAMGDHPHVLIAPPGHR